MPAADPQPRQLLQRRSERRRISVQVRYRRKVVRLIAKLTDLSCHGMRLASMERLAIGESVWVTLPGLEPKCANVVWSDGFEAGCVFAEPLHAAVLDAIIARRLG